MKLTAFTALTALRVKMDKEKLAIQLHNARCRDLVKLIREVDQAWGGTPNEDDLEDYIADQLRDWTNSTERLQSALDCFTELKEQKNGKCVVKKR